MHVVFDVSALQMMRVVARLVTRQHLAQIGHLAPFGVDAILVFHVDHGLIWIDVSRLVQQFQRSLLARFALGLEKHFLFFFILFILHINNRVQMQPINKNIVTSSFKVLVIDL